MPNHPHQRHKIRLAVMAKMPFRHGRCRRSLLASMPASEDFSCLCLCLRLCTLLSASTFLSLFASILASPSVPTVTPGPRLCLSFYAYLYLLLLHLPNNSRAEPNPAERSRAKPGQVSQVSPVHSTPTYLHFTNIVQNPSLKHPAPAAAAASATSAITTSTTAPTP